MLAEHIQRGEARITRHLLDLPGELAIGFCIVVVILFLVNLDTGGFESAWPFLLAFVIAAPLAWRRLRKNKKSPA